MSNSNLPPELIAEILPHLPVKSLSRFKCVSKSWATRISDPDFVKTHLHRAQFRRILLSSANSLYSIDHETDDLAAAVDLHYPRDQTQNPKPQSHAVQIIGSCNGLVCIMTQPDIFFIFNPTTHQSTRVPYAKMGFGGPSAAIGYGFGYAPSIDDYKLVKAAPSPDIGVFSLRDGDWHLRSGFLYQDPENPTRPGHFYRNPIKGEDPLPPATSLNGSLHWVFKLYSTEGRCIIGVFNLETDKRGFMQVPETAVSGFSTGVVNGNLCLMHREDGLRRGYFWVMKEYGVAESWTKILVEDPFLVAKPLCLWKNSKILIAKDKKELVLFDPKDGTYKNFEVGGIPNRFYADSYVESLVTVPVITKKKKSLVTVPVIAKKKSNLSRFVCVSDYEFAV
ncbi:f-box/kelch-repeat protein [Quercus suber]|uniref:F-box/kelch-repeat protein n=1 Tax=Quercus suber TaxID=58331 RepID=A0AAW0IXE4_QUESU